MKLTRQLRLDALATDGTAPLQLTSTWEDNRLRLGTGAVVHVSSNSCIYIYLRIIYLR